jgi:hypothetical protein
VNTTTSTFGSVLLFVVFSAVAVMRVSVAAEETSAATKTRMIQIIETLESNPFVKDGKKIRGEVMSWLTEAPDVAVMLCPEVLGIVRDDLDDDAATLVVQMMFSQAKFILEHPDKATDQHAVNVAGVEGVLRTYAAMQAKKPKLAIPEFDRLVKLQASGQLGVAVDEGLAKCE